MPFTRGDQDLYPVLIKASEGEMASLANIIADKWSSDIKDDCRDPYLLAKELQLMGGHSGRNLVRGHGVAYKELAYDAAKKIGAKVNATDAIEQIEQRLLTHLVSKAIDNMNEEQLRTFEDELREAGLDKGFTYLDALKHASTPAVMTVVANVSMPYILRSLGFVAAANLVGGRAVAAAIPVAGWALGVGSLVNSVAGTAFKVTIPCVAYIACIRARQASAEASEELGL